jgi:diguanylate cyclase (GGDEF)-like protein
MPNEIQMLTEVTRALQAPLSLEQVLQLVADTSARLVGTSRASVRLMDASRARLMAVVRAGEPVHADALKTFDLGEGLLGWVAAEGRAVRVGDAPSHPRYLARGDLKDPFLSFVGVPLLAGPACLGVLSATHEHKDHFTEHHEHLLELLAGICAPHVEIARLSRLSQVDPLTGALNRRGMDESYPPNGPVTDQGQGMVLVLADVDHFKNINDRYGHAAGDEALRRVTHLLSSVLRRGDAVVRFGGEEFLMFLPGLEMARGARVAERARAAVEGAPMMMGDVHIPLTVSMGVAELRPGERRDDLIKRADEAMLRAKGNGRNRVEAAR